MLSREPSRPAEVEGHPSASIEAYLPEPKHSALGPRGATISCSQVGATDIITIRDAAGLSVEVRLTDHGPELVLRGASIVVEAPEDLVLASKRIRLEASETLAVSAGAITTRTSARSTRVEGVDRLEAAAIETQASAGAIVLKAEGAIALDGESIGLNNDLCPAPFAWSERAREMST